MDQEEKEMYNLSIHDLTRRSTAYDRWELKLGKTFNSRPHEEVDTRS